MAVYSIESVQGLDHVQTVYKGKDNPIEIILKLDNEEYDYSSCKLIRVKIGNVEFDSTSDPTAFDRNESAIGKMKIFIGDQSNIVAQAYNVKLEIVDANDRELYFGQVRVRIDDPGM
jgi:hypothetical protein